MSLTQEIAAHIRQAKGRDRGLRISDFQIRVQKDRAALVNLKTGDIRIIPLSDDGQFAEFCERVEDFAQSANGFSPYLW